MSQRPQINLCRLRWGNHKKILKADEHLPFHKLIEDIMIGILNYMKNSPVNNNEDLLKREVEIMKQLSTLNSRKRHRNPNQFVNTSKLP